MPRLCQPPLGCAAAAGGRGSGTWFLIAGMLCRYVKIAARSSSVKFLYIGIGIGGRTLRPLPRWRPVRIVCVKVACVHLPRPVSGSGVRFAVKLTPHGPECAVFVGDDAPIHG